LNPYAIHTIEHPSSTFYRKESIQAVTKAIPKLNIDFQHFNDDEVVRIAETLLRHRDLFDTVNTKYGAA
jgi:hypothetical protein